ncbi:hypothetical protein A3H65_03530 [Candidatus Giovannonibacteria bacterium RIFCSPLOWO2_02_FULL_45_14]|uniref:SGNH hydrolase-type esterase domain-containing protein n=1 Tax=Candidatus Giovannonibacteria bacterium RIFCSPLOWO2_12_FULL_44_15 TaxID=1798364 RepID=A0A1F5XYI2_9BACT|nr:MAG: hypothetical protein A3E62_01050 [Candidatus Giovannonibacteria bacterium RIFCSPHIGHO2_12_FULL_44_29]OGF90896.1 MAG: hypothetical protein A3H65_03530 [Candidatus Giovannonibacteria bacterium RIFCSPLOWO2_02_FULL_45_14]OGF92964.1 MAG: hypothetical protein A3G54_01795 [Candidatus Giovannonibacteria bacterium RIFCSPLOWO2_12_FULL_44_15]
MPNICIFGDSITWGAVDPIGGGWANRLRNYFESKGQRVDQDFDIYNLGVSSDNTEDLLKRFKIEAEARKPEIILIAIGINDSQIVISENKNRVSLDKFRENLESIIKEAQKIKIIFIGLTRVDEAKTTPIPWNTERKYLNFEIEKYDSILKEAAANGNLEYIGMDKVLTEKDLEDGIHPNVSGHEKMFEIIKGKLDPIL